MRSEGELGGTSFARDKLGRVSKVRERIWNEDTDAYDEVTRDYEYDSVGRLVSVMEDGVLIEAYAYDDSDNRISARGMVATFDAQDRLLSQGQTFYTYTNRGSLSRKREGDEWTGDVTEYDYDVQGNLRSVSLPDGRVVSYLTDARNRRIAKWVDGSYVSGWAYKDQLNPIGELNSDGGIESLFIYDDGAHVPYAMLKGDVLYRIVTDHLGSVRLVVRASDGEIVQKMDYSAFGEVKQDTNPGFQPFSFAGGLYDADTGLVRFGARDYDPRTGRWTTKDPIGFQGGQANLYVYVGGDPVNRIDPEGLKDFCSWNDQFLKESLDNTLEEDYADELYQEISERQAIAAELTLALLTAGAGSSLIAIEKNAFKWNGVVKPRWHAHLGKRGGELGRYHLPHQLKQWYYTLRSKIKRMLK